VHPHRRRAAGQQLPALAAGLHRTVVHRYPVAGVRGRGTAARARRVRLARAALRPDRGTARRPGTHRPEGPSPGMTRTRVLAALVMAPVAIAAVLLLPTPWMVAAAAVVFLGGLWEWLRLAGVEDEVARGSLLVANLLLI